MMKKIALIVIAGFFGWMSQVSAQTITNVQALREATARLKIAKNANYAKAIVLAKKNGWPITYAAKGNRVATLVGVDELDFPIYYITNNNTVAAATTRANQLWPGGSSGLNLSGSTPALKNKLAIWDGGSVLGTHVELAGRVTQKDNPAATSDHSTHVAGTMIASGVNPNAKGMAFGLQGMIAYDFTNDLTEIASEAAGLLVSNHSYSIIAGWQYNSNQSRWEFNGLPNSVEDYKFGYYSDDAATLDDIAYNAQTYLIVKSAGNVRAENGPAVGQTYFRPNSSGTMISAGTRPTGISSNDSYDIISWDCTAKNILTVGAIGPLPNGYLRKEDIVSTDFSAWGPTDDGRIKPDIVADGVDVTSSINTSNTSYATYSGTSMSSPNAAGSLLLLQEYYAKLKPGVGFLRSATIKGLAIHTANEAGNSLGPDYQYGWGLLNVEKAAAVMTAAIPSNNASTSQHLLFESSLVQGGTFSQTVVASGKGTLQATICWTDPKGTPDPVGTLNSRNKKLVNDLDIRITKVGTPRVYFPWTLDVNFPSAAAVPGDNTVDNVERIDVDSTIAGQTYIITVTHKGTLVKGPQNFSLLVSGVGGTAYCASASGGGGARIDSVEFNNIKVQNSAGSKTYTDNSNIIGYIEPGQTVAARVRISTADATTNTRIIKMFIDYNNNGTFEANEAVGISGNMTSAAQTVPISVVIPTTVTVGNVYKLRVIVQETTDPNSISACGTYGKGETQDYSLIVNPPSTDVAITDATAGDGECAVSAYYPTIEIRNTGSTTISNIPVTVSIGTGGSVIQTLAFTYTGSIKPFTATRYTFQRSYPLLAGTVYTFTATSSLPADGYSPNNTLVSKLVTLAAPPAIQAVASICAGTTANMKVNNSNGGNYFWYSTATATSPFARGITASTTTIPADKTYYVAEEASYLPIGPPNKTTLGTAGGYNTFYDNFVKVNTTVPVVLTTARLYISYPGKILFRVGTIPDANSSYQNLYQTVIDVYPTTPTPVGGAVTGNNAADTGAIYTLNLPIPAGDHILLIQCRDVNGDTSSTQAANIFRNNGITGTTYPIAISNIMSITGNSASGQESQFYYFFYDTRINTLGTSCPADRVAVVATNAVKPTLTVVSNVLTSSVSSGNQWYLDGALITGATGASYTATKSGKYKTVVTDAFGCQTASDEVQITITAVVTVDPREIGLSVSPNPSNGVFNLSFQVTTKADLSIEILSASGQRVYNSTQKDFIGKYAKTISIPEVSSEFYILKVQHDKKTYSQKILIQR